MDHILMKNLHITKWVGLFVCFQLLGKCHFGAPGPWLAPPLSKAILMNNLHKTIYFPLLGKCHSKNWTTNMKNSIYSGKKQSGLIL